MDIDELEEPQEVQTPKSAEELARIGEAVKTNFLFAHLNDVQRVELYKAMKRVEVSAGDVVIKQGDPGDWFYVVDSGQFAVTQRQGEGAGMDVQIFTYKSEGTVHHCFGELALMYSKPRAATVTATMEGALWAMARSSFRRVLIKSSASTLTKALRSVDVLSSLSALQLQRLHDILTEVTYADGEAIISQGDTGKQFYIIVEGDVLCTRREDPVNLAEEPTELMRLRQYQYFGERALLHDAPRAATVTAVGPTKCLSVERDAFEEVLGPLQKIIDAHAKHRESQALVKRLEAEAVGLTSANVDDFGVLSVVRRGDTGDDWAIVVKRGRRAGEADRHYTMRSFGKAAAVEKQQLLLLKHERELTGQLPLSSPGVALELVSFPSHTALHSVLKSVLLTNLETVMDETMSESTVRFYIASLAQALGALHNESVAFRNVNPEYLMLDSSGYVQLADFRLSKRVEGKTFTTCGAPDYLAPEVVKGEGHGLAADYWALGVLMYEMLLGESPFKGAGEMDMYQNITSHRFKIELRGTADLGGHTVRLLDELLHHDPVKRLGSKHGFEDLQGNMFFSGYEWVALASRQVQSPHMAAMAKLFEQVKAAQARPVAEVLAYPAFEDADNAFADFGSSRVMVSDGSVAGRSRVSKTESVTNPGAGVV